MPSFASYTTRRRRSQPNHGELVLFLNFGAELTDVRASSYSSPWCSGLRGAAATVTRARGGRTGEGSLGDRSSGVPVQGDRQGRGADRRVVESSVRAPQITEQLRDLGTLPYYELVSSFAHWKLTAANLGFLPELM